MKARYSIEAFFFRIVLMLARITPHSLMMKAGNLFGRFAFAVDSRHRIVALENFMSAFPQATRQEARQAILKTYRFFGRYLFDILSYLANHQRIAKLAEFEFEGLDNLQKAVAQNKGIIFFTGHWGAWELMALAAGIQHFPVELVARKLDNPYLESLLTKFRTATGNRVIDKNHGLKSMLRALRERRGVAILIDQNVSSGDRVFVNFFGKPASTTPVVGLLKARTDAVILPVFAIPMGENSYRFVFGSEVITPQSDERDADILAVTQRCTEILENQIRKYPEYWLWMHRRWKTRPETTE